VAKGVDQAMSTPLGSVTRASVWTLAGYGGSQVLRLGGNLVLWRLLYPEAFGLMAIVNVFMQGLAMFSDVGIGPSIIQNARGEEPDHQNTAFTIQAARGLVLCLAAFALAKPVAGFYGEPALASLIPVVAFGAVLAGFNATSMFTAARRISLGRLTMMDLVAQGAGLVVMVGWGFAFRNIWALVVGGLVSNATRLAMSHTFLPGIRNRLRWDPDRARALLRFGRWIFFSTLLSFAVAQSDRLIFGKLIPMSLLGVYSIATVWAQLPASIVDRVFNSVVFPLLSSRHNQGADLSPAFLASRRPWLIFAGWAASGLMAGGPTLIHFFYDARAASAGWIVQTLAVSTWLYTLETTNSTVLLAVGKPNWVAIGSAAKLFGMVVGIPVGMASFGFPGAVLGLAASEFLRYVTSVVGARKNGVFGLGEDMLLSLLMGATVLFGLFTRLQVRAALSGVDLGHPKVALVLEGLAIAVSVSLAWGALFLRHRSRTKLAANA
jgi:O-antigen/teichoic acid export membrane protein